MIFEDFESTPRIIFRISRESPQEIRPSPRPTGPPVPTTTRHTAGLRDYQATGSMGDEEFWGAWWGNWWCTQVASNFAMIIHHHPRFVFLNPDAPRVPENGTLQDCGGTNQLRTSEFQGGPVGAWSAARSIPMSRLRGIVSVFSRKKHRFLIPEPWKLTLFNSTWKNGWLLEYEFISFPFGADGLFSGAACI